MLVRTEDGTRRDGGLHGADRIVFSPVSSNSFAFTFPERSFMPITAIFPTVPRPAFSFLP
jgi:hypothetical protein